MAYQTTVVSGGSKKASTTVLYGTTGSVVTSAPGKTALTGERNNSNPVKSSTHTGVGSVYFGNLSHYADGYYIIGGLSSLINGIGYGYFNKYYAQEKPKHNHLLSNVYTTKALSWNLVTGLPTNSGIVDSFGRDDAIVKSHGGEFVFIPAGKLPSQGGGNAKYYTYAAKTNG